jgi:hypothetical protein
MDDRQHLGFVLCQRLAQHVKIEDATPRYVEANDLRAGALGDFDLP